MATAERTLAAAIRQMETEIETRRDELVAIVAELVKRPSELGHEAEAQAYVAEHLHSSGMEVELWEPDSELKHHPEGGDSGVSTDGRPNVAGASRGTGSGRSLILNGHIDVVSPEPLDAWTRDPWGAEIRGNLMYGRGAYDMKSGVAINLFLPRVLRDLGLSLAGDLFVHSVIEEECTGLGALAASLRHRADAAVVTEPEAGNFTHAHVGVLWFRIRVTGKSWHVMRAREGVNAITKSVAIIQALEALDQQLNEAVHPLWAGVEHPINLNVGVIHGGNWPSNVPGSCELHCRVSFFPGQTVGEMRALIEETVRRVAERDDWMRQHPPVVSYDGFGSSGSTVSLDEPMVRLLGEHHRRITGTPMQPIVGTAINDMRYYNFVGVPSGCYGARGGNGHGADEWLDLDSLVPTAKVLGGFLLEWCGLGS